MFTRFHTECAKAADGSDWQYSYQGLVHRSGSLFEDAWWGAGENAIVDFKYSSSPKLTWWFDHHLSAFMTVKDEETFRRGQMDGSQTMRQFFDPAYTSCTSFIAHVAETKFGMDVGPFAELIHWADIVDGAKYESAKAAVEMADPAMKLTMVIESAPDENGESVSKKFIPLMTEMPLQAVLDQPFVQALLGPLMDRHWKGLELIRERAVCEGGVISFDITDQPTEGYNKFIPYYLFPEGTYNVGLSKSSFRTKVSVGTNPWTTNDAKGLANIAAICERYGGGGHARVGAISFQVDQEEEARVAVREIVAELKKA
jgi:hypothetical protein